MGGGRGVIKRHIKYYQDRLFQKNRKIKKSKIIMIRNRISIIILFGHSINLIHGITLTCLTVLIKSSRS